MDIKTPRNIHLSGFFRRSNAVSNAEIRVPNYLKTVLNELTDRLVDIQDTNGKNAFEEMKDVIVDINILRREVIQDIPFRKLVSEGEDVEYYNFFLELLSEIDCRPSMLQTRRLFSECYVYRRIWECFELTQELREFDPYETIKHNIFWICKEVITKTGHYLKNIHKYPSVDDKIDFEKLLKLALWSSQSSDFVISEQYVKENISDILKAKKLEPFIVVNHFEEAWKVISDRQHASNTVAFICDNCGFEFFLDLCIADYLFKNFYARSAHFHVKHIPWFISDITEKDIDWILTQLSRKFDKIVQNFANEWRQHFKMGRWKIIARKYWTLPIGFTKMKEIDPDLYGMLENTKLTIVKGDLNYRKLIEDKNYDVSTPFTEILNDFYPCNLLMIRIMKSDIVCNIPPDVVKKFEKLDKHWLDCGKYGIIQFTKNPKENCICLE